MEKNNANTKRIAKNTLLLYVRMLLLMLVSLYTSRVVLDTLGVTDFGIYNVVGGIVAMLGFLSGSMANAVQRYLSFELGKNNTEGVGRVFSTSLLAHTAIAIFVLIFMEIFGVWYLEHHLNLPEDRLNAAHWVLQCSIITTIFTIMQVPYNAIIIAKEKMGIYAYISIIEAFLKLLVAYLLVLGDFDRLKFYAVLMMGVTISILMIYRIYCIRTFTEARFRFIRDWKLLKELISFSGWNMLGELAWVFTGQGVNIILNSFMGPAVNAARAIAEQVNGTINRFVQNFQTAVNPQLIKTYAADQLEQMKSLLFRGTRFSFYLLFALSLPLILCMDFVLSVWLKEVPEYTVEFCQLILISSLVGSVSNLLSQVARASGNISKYQIVVSSLLFLNFPLSFLVLKLGYSPVATLYVHISIQVVLIFARLKLTAWMIHMSITDFIKNALARIVFVSLLSVLPAILLKAYLPNNLWGTLSLGLFCLAIVCINSYFVGMDLGERNYINKTIKNFVGKFVK